MGIIKQKGAPTRHTAAGVGSMLIDMNTGKQYMCTFAYCTNGVWEYEWRETAITEKVIPVKVEVKNEKEDAEPQIEQKVDEPIRSHQPKRANYTQYGKKSK